MIESEEIVLPLGRIGMGRRIGMYIPTSVKSPKIQRVAILRIFSLVFSTRLRGLIKV